MLNMASSKKEGIGLFFFPPVSLALPVKTTCLKGTTFLTEGIID